MKRNNELAIIGSGLSVLAVSVLFVSCGGGGGDGSGGGGGGAAQPAQIDTASVTKALPEISRVVPICSAGAAAAKSLDKSLTTSTWLDKLLAVRSTAPTAKALTSTRPADITGQCGGKITYLNYSHNSGITMADYAFQDYCTTDAAGTKTIVNGTVPFTNTATPTATGPVFQKLEAGSTGDIVVVQRNSADAVISTEKLNFSGFSYTAGAPGGTPTASNPDVMKLGNVAFTNKDGKAYRQSGYTVTTYETANGGEQLSVNGTGYRSDGSSYTVSSSQALTIDSEGNWSGGQLTFTGANGQSAVATLVPGSLLQATMLVNGQVLTTGIACR